MKNDIIQINKEKINYSHSKNLKIHIKLKDETWRNGFIKEIEADFFIFDDKVNGSEAIFFIEVETVKPYTEREEENDM